MECPNCKEKSLRNMESKEEQQALDCMTRHIRAFLLQSSEGRKADYGEPCENCEKIKECNFDWLSKWIRYWKDLKSKLTWSFKGV